MNRSRNWENVIAYRDAADGYLRDPEAYIRFFQVIINGKLRHLVTYQPTEEGRALRALHTSFARFLSGKYKSAASSFAYAKGKNILDCVNKHLDGEVFLKTDIHAYFDSISCEKMLNRIKELRLGKKCLENIDLVTKACFFQGKLPLGFTSSPIMSDLFLVSLDQEYQVIEGINYTRYADDFIISSSGEGAEQKLALFKDQLEKDLSCLNLELNRRKTYIRTLKAPGDAIHVLGVNIVKTDTEKNRVTISDRYIRETCRMVCDWMANPASDDDGEILSKLIGRIGFIKQCSGSSFQKMIKMTRIKTGKDCDLSIKALRKFKR